MKLKKVFNYFIIVVVTLILLTGCNNTAKPEETKKEVDKIKGNCEIQECIKLIETSNSIEEINDIIGFKAEKSEYSETYTWKLSEKTWIDATPSTSDSSYSVSANYDKTTIKNDQADFSSFNEMRTSLGKGESFTYEEVVKKVGGVEGTLAGKTSTSKRYIWVNKYDQTFSATFSDTNDGKTSIISLR